MKYIFYLILAAFVWPLFAFENQIFLGKEDNWNDFMKFQEIKLEEGKWGFLDMVLEDAEKSAENDADLLLHFNNSLLSDETYNYSIQTPVHRVSDKIYVYGEKSGAFQRAINPVELFPSAKALFYPGTLWDDFTIDFWLYPINLEDGEIIIQWKGTRLDKQKIIHQNLLARILNRQLHWEFENFFLSPTKNESRFHLKSIKQMLPGRWYHHVIRFDSTSGLFEYLIDGEPEAIIYATDSGRERGNVNHPFIGYLSTGNLILGKNFTGYIDEFKISRSFVENASSSKYKNRSGTAESKPFDLEFYGSRVKKIEADYKIPGTTEIYFYYKIADTLKNWNTLDTEWIQFQPGEELTGNSMGKYFQLKVELFPDGNKKLSPAVSMLKFTFEPDLPPSPPSGLTAFPENGKVKLFWEKVNEYDIRGYQIYYGEQSGSYSGSRSLQGTSPIDVGDRENFEVTGLINGKLYYFTIVAYDSAVPPHTSIFSKEVSARPSALNK